jgi:citrate lyase subunit alpha/citrate CoA-transferase
MNKYDKLVTNAAGRVVPTILNGKPAVPYMGIGKLSPPGEKLRPHRNLC